MEGNDPLLAAVLAAATGSSAVVQTSKTPAPVVPKTTTPIQPKAVVEDPEMTRAYDPEELKKAAEGNGSAASSDAQDQPKTTAPSQASGSAPSKTDPADDKVDLPKLQALAAQLLQAGERRTLKSILDENGVKSLSTAPEDAYEMLFGALTEAVSALAAA
jgi:hypothetical protein